MSDQPSPLDDHGFLDTLFNVVIPESASGGIPAAGVLGLAPMVVAGLRADPLLGPMVEAGLKAVYQAARTEGPIDTLWTDSPEGTQFLQARLSSQPLLVMGLLRHLYPAYYQHPRVLAAIGEVTRPPFPEGFEVDPTDPELLRRLESRRKTGPADRKA